MNNLSTLPEWNEAATEPPSLYSRQPDFTRPRLHVTPADREDLRQKLAFLYGPERAARALPELERLLQVHHAHKTAALEERERCFDPAERFTQEDIVLITYADLLKSSNGHRPLEVLHAALKHGQLLSRIFNTVHILPFYPSTSDRGFAVSNFRAVSPRLGSWEDIRGLGGDFELMFDGVFNHASSHSPAFEHFLNGDPAYKDVFMSFTDPAELTDEQRACITRPRTSDVLTRFDTIDGPRWVWTTFSPDQVDLNFANPRVLLWIIETLLLYVRHGADVIRLDAVTYIWRQPGTTCANLPQGHAIVRLLRLVLDLVAPTTALITETNVPHHENISYFGNGSDEAQMVYNFALPPLVLHAFYRGDATALTRWADTLEYPVGPATFFNILDTHDGIGLQGVKGILPPEEIDFIIEEARGHGAFISHKAGPGGLKEPYEINTTWFSSLSSDHEAKSLQVKRFVASRSIALALRGVPGIYLHGLLASRNDTEAVVETHRKRDINRAGVGIDELLERLHDPDTRISRLARELPRLTDIRKAHRAFHPRAPQQVLNASPKVFALLRTSPELDEHILALTNVTAENTAVTFADLPVDDERWLDLVGETLWNTTDGTLTLYLEPYQVMWLMPFAELEREIEG